MPYDYTQELMRLAHLMDTATSYAEHARHQRAYRDVVQVRDQERRQADPMAFAAAYERQQAAQSG